MGQMNINDLYRNVIQVSGVQYDPESRQYFVFDAQDVVFSIKYNAFTGEYKMLLHPNFQQTLQKYGFDPETNKPKFELVYNWVEFQNQIYKIITSHETNVKNIFDQLVPYVDVSFKMHKGFETYIAHGFGDKFYCVGYNPDTKQYGFQRYEPMISMYDYLGIPSSSKPDYQKLYDRTKQMYLTKIVIENMQNLEIY